MNQAKQNLINELEVLRQENLKLFKLKFVKYNLIYVLSVFIIYILIITYDKYFNFPFSKADILFYIMIIIGLLIPAKYYFKPIINYRKNYHDKMIKQAFNKYGNFKYNNIKDEEVSDDVKYILSSKVIPRYDSRSGSIVSGKYNNDDLKILQVHLTEEQDDTDMDGKKTTKTVTVFKGLILRVKLPFSTESHTVMTRKSFLTKFSKLSKIEHDNVELAKSYKIHTNNNHNAFYIFNNVFCANILKINDKEEFKSINIEFNNDEVTLALRTNKFNPFNSPSIFKQVTSENLEILEQSVDLILNSLDNLDIEKMKQTDKANKSINSLS
tara:strand:- start:1356 stop:2333 length:978 start_codon:yes stop_codon:yes gene_type:complete